MPQRPGALPAHTQARSGAAERLAAAFLLSYEGNTRAAYARDLTDYGRWCQEYDVDILAARRVHLDAYVEHLRRSGVTAATLARRLSALSSFYAYAVDEQVVEHNPAARVRRPKVGENVQSTGLSAAEARVLLTAAERHSARAAVVVNLLLFCGLRVSELCTATVADLSYERGHRVLTVTRKGGRRQKMVIPPRAIDALDRYLAERAKAAQAAAAPADAEPAHAERAQAEPAHAERTEAESAQPERAGRQPLVATATGRPTDRHAIWRLLRRLAVDALPHLADSLHPHDLRHACATLSLDTGASLRDVQDLLGHQDSRTTRRYDRARHNLDRSPSYALATLLPAESNK